MGESGAGKRHTRLVIETDTSTDADRDGGGQRVPDWQIYGKFWAESLSQSGREFYRASQIHSDISHLWELRYSDKANKITTQMRCRIGSRLMGILSVINVDEANRKVQIVARETKT